MTTLREAAQQALEALEDYRNGSQKQDSGAVITALKAALEQPEPEPEPVACFMENIQSGDIKLAWNDDGFDRAIWHEKPLYTHPPLEQPEQKPVAWQWLNTAHFRKKLPAKVDPDAWNPLYTHPPRRLTDEVIADLWYQNGTYHHHFARAIERWLKGEG